jgi:uncharacterized membrane protein required for colicin V production
MTIWILAVLLVLSLAGLGYRQGAIRVAFSLIGIFMGVMLAVPLGKPMAILLKAFGVQHPVLLWMLPPFVAFCVISAIFKSIALAVHHKVEVYFKYKAGDLRLSLWERMNRRVGLCLGIVNGVAYMVLVSFVIYVIGYWTVQLESDQGMSKSARLFTRAAKDLQSTGFIKTARALDRMPASYYEAADVAGLIYQNSLIEARLARYPAFLMLGERSELQTLAGDQTFSEMRARKDSASQLLQYGPLQTIAKDSELLREIWRICAPDLKDLKKFLETAQSPKYSEEPILGRWNFDVRGTVAALRRANPNMTALEMTRSRRRLQEIYAKTKVVVGTEGRVVIKDWPDLAVVPGKDEPQAVASGKGTWDGGGGFYKVNFTVGSTEMSGTAAIEGERMTVTLGKAAVAFEREY